MSAAAPRSATIRIPARHRAVKPMLPISLTLSNFLSYRDDAPTLHLDGVRLACLCGPNGHGKPE